eukprot:COSAG05_NODE_676_length_7987_cov_3.066041_2_plen_151_part_00
MECTRGGAAKSGCWQLLTFVTRWGGKVSEAARRLLTDARHPRPLCRAAHRPVGHCAPYLHDLVAIRMACPRTRGASRRLRLGMAMAGRLTARLMRGRGHSPAASEVCLVGRSDPRPGLYRRSLRAGCEACTRTAIKTAESTALPRPHTRV